MATTAGKTATRTYEIEVLIRNLTVQEPLPTSITSAKFDPMLACCILENERATRDKGKPIGRGKFSLGNALDWENKFKMRCNLHSDTLQIELWDDNILRDTFLCCCRVPLRSLLAVPGRGIGVMERQLTFMPGEAHTLTGLKRGEAINATCVARITRLDNGDAELAPEAVGVNLREIPAGASALPAGGMAAGGMGAGGLAAGGLAAGGLAAGGLAAGAYGASGYGAAGASGMQVTQPATAAIAQPSTFVEQGVVYEKGVQNVNIPSTTTVAEQVPTTVMKEELVQVPRVIMVEERVQVPQTVMQTQYKEVPTSIPAQQEVVRPVGVERVTEVKERLLGAVGPAEPIGQPVPISQAAGQTTTGYQAGTAGYQQTTSSATNAAYNADRRSNL